MPFQPGDLIPLSIEDIGSHGEGIGRYQGVTLFVTGALPGDVVTARITHCYPRYAKGITQGWVSRSPDRVVPRCELVGQCGGCQLQALGMPAQLALKQRRVTRLLSFTKAPLSPIVGMASPWEYRNKAMVPIHASGMGFYHIGSHEVVPLTTCAIQDPRLTQVLAVIRTIMATHSLTGYDETHHTGALRGVLLRHSDTHCVVVLMGRGPLDDASCWMPLTAVDGLTGIGWMTHSTDSNRMIEGDLIPIWGDLVITHSVQGLVLSAVATSFFQVNPVQYDRIMALVGRILDQHAPQSVWDLYAGVGGFGLLAAQKGARVRLGEWDATAIEWARVNAAQNHCEGVVWGVGDAADLYQQWVTEAGVPDMVMLDPPRKGLSPHMLAALQRHPPRQVLMVSCDVATLARDLRALSAHYQCLSIDPFDMFPHTVHIECVALLSRLN